MIILDLQDSPRVSGRKNFKTEIKQSPSLFMYSVITLQQYTICYRHL